MYLHQNTRHRLPVHLIPTLYGLNRALTGLCGQNIFGISKKKERNIIALPFPSVNFMFVPDFCFAFLPVAERKTNSFRETGLLVRVESA